MESTRDIKAIIVGAGIGGLTAGIALRRAGVDATVFERATDLRRVQVGGGLHIWPNAMRALRQLGLEDQARSVGAEVGRVRFMTWNGKVLADLDVAAVGQRLGTTTVGVRRAGLHRVLAETFGDEALRLGAECAGFTQDVAGLTVRFKDGREERADLLVGADGINSVIRANLLGPAKPRYAGYTSWIGLADGVQDRVPGDVLTVTWGAGARFIFYHVGEGRVGWIGNANAPEGERDDGRRKATVLAAYREWAQPIPTIIEATEEAAIARMDLYDRDPTKRWGEGRVTLLGDAAHPMTPNIAQGACQAIEDAIVLAKCLTSESVIVAALRAYEARRIERTAPLQMRARRIGDAGQWERPWACALRDRTLSLFSGLMEKQEAKLYSYEV